MAQLLFGRPIWTFAAGLLMSVEHLNVVMSRTGLLDVHLEFWVVLGFLCLLLDRRWIDRETPPDPEPMKVKGERRRDGQRDAALEQGALARSGGPGGSPPAPRSVPRAP